MRHEFLHLKFAIKCIALYLSAALILSSCGKINISANFKGPIVNDFQKSEIISNGPAIADGSSELLVVIQLMNSDGTPVKQYRPTYEVISGVGVLAAACTTSNNNGVSTCVLKSTMAGTKRISVTNLGISLKADVIFNQPSRKPIFGLASAAGMQTSGSHVLTATIGGMESEVVKVSGSYKLFGGVTGQGVSR